jgi:glycerol-3-phosphate dehydrogenase (NAD(P)+)
MKPHVGFIGAGKLGSAVAGLLRGNAAAVELWDKDPSLVSNQKPLAHLAGCSDVLFFCVHSRALPEAFAAVRPHLRRRTVAVCVSKGIERRSGLTVDRLYRKLMPASSPFVFLGGAMLAAELVGKEGGAGLAASSDARALRLMRALFRGTGLRIETSRDVAGAAACGVLKNVYAIGLGMAEGLGWGNNLKGWLAAEAIREMAAMLPILGGRRETAYGTAGAGDLLATGFSAHSTHRKVGHDFALTGRLHDGCEGVLSLPVLKRRLDRRAKAFPLFLALEGILLHEKPPELLRRRS